MIKISVVIPNFNGRFLLEKNLPAVVRACESWSKTGWEIIVVDDASTDDSVGFLQKEFPTIKIIKHASNRRFAQSCNSGVASAQGEIIILLNHDVSPDKNFVTPLLKHFADRRVFAVGCLEKDPLTGIASGRGIMAFKRGLVVHWRAEDQNQPTSSWVSGGSAAFDRAKWVEIGGMDTLFRPAYEEDRDICYVAQKHDWKILFEPKSLVHHHHGTSNRLVFGVNKVKIMSFKNQFLFVWKNITDLRYLLLHLFWLPYHLTVTNLRTGGLLGIGFLSALLQLPEALSRRRRVKRLFEKSDSEII